MKFYILFSLFLIIIMGIITYLIFYQPRLKRGLELHQGSPQATSQSATTSNPTPVRRGGVREPVPRRYVGAHPDEPPGLGNSNQLVSGSSKVVNIEKQTFESLLSLLKSAIKDKNDLAADNLKTQLLTKYKDDAKFSRVLRAILMDATSSPEIRKHSFDLCIQIADKTNVLTMIEVIEKEKDLLLKEHYLQNISQMKNTEATNFILAEIKNPDRTMELRSALAKGLGNIGTKESVTGLLNAYQLENDPQGHPVGDSISHQILLSGLANIKNTSIAFLLTGELAKSKDEQLKETIVNVLLSNADKHVVFAYTQTINNMTKEGNDLKAEELLNNLKMLPLPDFCQMIDKIVEANYPSNFNPKTVVLMLDLIATVGDPLGDLEKTDKILISYTATTYPQEIREKAQELLKK